MTAEQKAGNALIAEFMGWETNHYIDDHGLVYITPFSKIPCTIRALEFNTSWDWLMPACKKFCDTPNTVSNGYGVFGRMNHALIAFDITLLFKSLIEGIEALKTQQP